jgi:Cu/Ag efflux protein CusF
MKIGKGMVTGLGIASLLVAFPGSATEKSGSATEKPGSAMEQPGAATEKHEAMGGTASAGAAGQNEITGKVEKYDKAKKELSLRLKVSDDTQVMKDGQRASLSDIKEGDQVRASFTGSGENLQVQRIDVVSSGAKGGTLSPGAPSGAPGGGSTGGSSGSSEPPGSGRGY